MAAKKKFKKPEFVWKKYRTARALFGAYVGSMDREARRANRKGFSVEDSVFVMSNGEEWGPEQFLHHIAKPGMWAFTSTTAKPPVIHYWHDGKRTETELAMMFGHELGHNLGTAAKNDWKEECRADDYGIAAVHALRRVRREKTRTA